MCNPKSTSVHLLRVQVCQRILYNVHADQTCTCNVSSFFSQKENQLLVRYFACGPLNSVSRLILYTIHSKMPAGWRKLWLRQLDFDTVLQFSCTHYVHFFFFIPKHCTNRPTCTLLMMITVSSVKMCQS